MGKINRDILAERPELKGMPYSVPEGYFDAFKAQVKPYEARPAWKRMMPYASVAAALLFLFTAGTLFFQRGMNEHEITQEDFLVFSNSITDMEYYGQTDHFAEAEVADDDIIEYLIYSGISMEEIELYR